MPDAPFALPAKIELATKAYLAARIAAAAPSALDVVEIRTAQELASPNIKLPLVTVELVNAPTFDEDNTLYMSDLLVGLACLADKPAGPLTTANDPAQLFTARKGLLAEWLADREGFKAYINEGRRPWITPEPDPVDPPAAGLLVHDIRQQDERAEYTSSAAGGHWVGALSYLVPAQLLTGD